jgi:hypothetical protein
VVCKQWRRMAPLRSIILACWPLARILSWMPFRNRNARVSVLSIPFSPSMIRTLNGPKICSQHKSMASCSVLLDLSLTVMPACQRSALSTMCQIEKTSKNMMSASTSTFCSVINSTDGVMSGFGRCQGLQLLHVLMICGIIATTFVGSDAAPNILSMAALGACHHLKCNLRTSNNCCSSVPCRKTRKLLSALKFVQSVGALSVLKSGAGNRGCRSGPLRRVLFCFRSGGPTRGGERACEIASLDPLDGPDVLSTGGASGSWTSASGMSFADAFPVGSLPTGIDASRGCLCVSLGRIDGILQPSSCVCDACPRGFGFTFPSGVFQLHPGQVHSFSHFSSGTV